jgi:uncharacterized membrane protein
MIEALIWIAVIVAACVAIVALAVKVARKKKKSHVSRWGKGE